MTISRDADYDTRGDMAQLAWLEGQIEADWARISADQEREAYAAWLADRLENGFSGDESTMEDMADEQLARWEAVHDPS